MVFHCQVHRCADSNYSGKSSCFWLKIADPQLLRMLLLNFCFVKITRLAILDISMEKKCSVLGRIHITYRTA
jgi:hypothetical protein